MPLETNLTDSPYWDDFDESKNFHRILFNPSRSVQAREMNQLQNILQNQVEKFGDNIYREGTIIKGCSFSTDNNYYYIKILDNQVDGQTVNINQFANTLLRNETSNLEAIVVNQTVGLESQNPDLNTLYIKYINSGSANSKVYTHNTTLSGYNLAYTQQLANVANIVFDDADAGFSNKPTITLDPSLAWVSTIANNDVVYVEFSANNNGVFKVDTRESNTVISLQAGSTLVDETNTSNTVTIDVRSHIADLSIASNATYTDPVGTGYAFKVTDGIIYQKGHFIRADNQTG